MASCCFFISVICSFFSFREAILKLRKGIWDIPAPREKFEVIGAVSYNGVVISNFLVGFVIVLVILSLIFIVLCFKFLWELLYQYIWTIVILLIPFLIQVTIVILFKQCAATQTYVIQRLYNLNIKFLSYFSFLDVIMFFMGIVGSVLPALMRFIIVICVTAIGIARVDQPVLPNWTLKIMWLDLANSTYLSSIVMHNNHNHPVFVTIAMKLCNLIFEYHN